MRRRVRRCFKAWRWGEWGKAGQSLVEIAVGLAVLVIAVGGIYGVVSRVLITR